MSTVPETKYARSGSLHIAYQVIGGGSLDLVLRFEDRGTHALKGVPGEWRLFAVASERAA